MFLQLHTSTSFLGKEIGRKILPFLDEKWWEFHTCEWLGLLVLISMKANDNRVFLSFMNRKLEMLAPTVWLPSGIAYNHRWTCVTILKDAPSLWFLGNNAMRISK